MGADLGQGSDPTAVAVGEQWLREKTITQVGTGRARARRVATSMYDVVHLERVPLGTPYTATPGVDSVGTRLSALINSPDLQGEATLVVDATGVGRAVVDILRAQGLAPVPVIISAGHSTTVDDDGYYHVPKRDLVAALIVLLQEHRLRIGPVPEARTLGQEIQNFKMKFTQKGHDQYQAWREGQHDDLVLATCLICWYALQVGGWAEQLPDEDEAKSDYDPLRYKLNGSE